LLARGDESSDPTAGNGTDFLSLRSTGISVRQPRGDMSCGSLPRPSARNGAKGSRARLGCPFFVCAESAAWGRGPTRIQHDSGLALREAQRQTNHRHPM